MVVNSVATQPEKCPSDVKPILPSVTQIHMILGFSRPALYQLSNLDSTNKNMARLQPVLCLTMQTDPFFSMR